MISWKLLLVLRRHAGRSCQAECWNAFEVSWLGCVVALLYGPSPLLVQGNCCENEHKGRRI